MPEDKFNFAPPASLGEFKDVRTFAQQIKHVAEANYYFFGGSKYSEADVKTLTDSIEKLTTKADIVKALKDSFTQAHAFVDDHYPGECLCDDGAWHARWSDGGLWNRARHGSLRTVSGVSAHERDCSPASRKKSNVRPRAMRQDDGRRRLIFGVRPVSLPHQFWCAALRKRLRRLATAVQHPPLCRRFGGFCFSSESLPKLLNPDTLLTVASRDTQAADFYVSLAPLLCHTCKCPPRTANPNNRRARLHPCRQSMSL